MAWETQGKVTDRTQEHLATGDEGVIVLRRLLREQIERVQQGLDPLGIIRDPAKNTIIDLGVINERIGVLPRRSTEPARDQPAAS